MNIFKRLAAYCVTGYAERLFDRAVRTADQRNLTYHGRNYVLSHPTNERKLIVVTAKEFQRMRREMHIPKGYLPADCLETQCWYRTSGVSGKDKMPYRDYQIRRLAFIRMLLRKARLA